jgi:anti-sigma B factor antagonist
MDVRKAAPKTAVIDIYGDVTSTTESVLTEAFNQASSDGTYAVLLNFSHMGYMNSSGIGLLVTLLIRAQRQGQKLLAYGLSDHYRQIFQLTRLDEVIGIYESEKDAMKATVH